MRASGGAGKGRGDKITVSVEGPDEDAAARALREAFEF
ncbi:HPr family phosphocarrier protein [Tractidigestivibacter sp.]